MNHRKRLLIVLVFTSLVIAALTLAACDVQGQTYVSSTNNEPYLSVTRSFGFSSGADIRGTFKLSVVNVVNPISVTYLLDGEPLGLATSTPYDLTIVTQNFAEGAHTLSASVATVDGKNVQVTGRPFNFVSSDVESKTMVGIILPLVLAIVGVMALVLGAQWVLSRRGALKAPEAGSQRNYGITGGAICPKCNRPTRLHLMSPHFGNVKFDYCENCGRWSMLRPVSLDQLRAAEVTELADSKAGQVNLEKSEDEKTKEMLDESKYTD